MGMPAVKRAETRVPRLRDVSRRPSSKKRAKRSAASDAYLRGFQMCVLLMVCASLFGMGRVMLSAKAVEASFESEILVQDIKAEQLTGDLLEVDKSALGTPSRIEQIASETMRMSEAADVTYMCLPDDAAAPVLTEEETTEAEEASEGGLAALFSSVMEMTAGEAQVLLVGDLGLASSR